MRMWLLLGLWAGCGSGDKNASAPEESAAYITDDDTTEIPDLNPSYFSGVIDEAIAAVMSLRTSPISQGYIAATAGGDTDCPTLAENNGVAYWIDTCVSDDGTRFDGVGTITTFEDFTNEGGYTYTGMQMYAVATVTDPEGHTFQGTGSAADLRGTGPYGEWIQFVQIEGDFSWDGPEAAGTWLESDLSADIAMMASTDPTGWRNLGLDGVVQGLYAADAVIFHDLQVLSGLPDDSCTPEPTGAISVRDLDGNWIDLEFHGPEEGQWPPDEAACDGCAQAWYLGLDMGQVCPKFNLLRNWEGPHPWI